MPRRSITSTTSHFRNSGSNFGSPSPSPVPQSPSWNQTSHSFPVPGVLPVRGFGTPVNASVRTSKYLDGKASRSRGGDSLEELADNGSDEPMEVLPSDITMSRDPSGQRSISIQAGPHRQSQRLSLNSGTLLPHGRSLSLSHDSSGLQTSARGSIIRARSDSRSDTTSRFINQGDHHLPHSGERSYESLQKEVIKLQEVLKEREDEIRSLEISIREIRRLSDCSTPPLPSASTDGVDDELRIQTQADQKAESSTRFSIGSISASNSTRDSTDRFSLSHPDKIIAAIQSQMSLNDADVSVVKDSQNIKLLDNLMRSMAQKESAHLELIENLKDKLTSTKRQHDDLVNLSRDQVVNMSSEIEALRQKLANPTIPDSEIANRLTKLEGLLRVKEQESESLKAESTRQLLDLEVKLVEAKQAEIEALKHEHDTVVEQLKIEQRESLNRLIESSDEKLAAKHVELRQLQDQWQSQSQLDVTAQTDKIKAEFEAEQKKLMESQTQDQEDALHEQQSRFDNETHQLLDQHAQAFEYLRDELTQNSKRTEIKYEAQIEELKQSHATEITRLTTTLSSRANQGNNTMEKLIRDHHDELDELRNSMEVQLSEQRAKFEMEKQELNVQHEEEIKSLETRHETQIVELKSEHEEILVASLTELDLRRTRKFESNLAALQEKHQAEINEIKGDHEKQIQAVSISLPHSNASARSIDVTSTSTKRGSPDGDTRRLSLEKIQSSYEQKIEMLKLQHQTDLHALEEKFLTSNLSSDLREERLANQRKIDLLTDELDYLKEEVQKHKASESQDSNREAAQSEAEVELQEALDALSTLDKALLESQTEREDLLKQLEDIKKSNMSEQETMAKDFTNLQSEFARIKQERDELIRSSKEFDHQSTGRPSYDGPNGRSGAGMGSDSPSLPGLPTRTHLSSSGKPPPPTPPPNIPPPPPPTNLSNLPGINNSGGSTSNSVNGTIRRPTRTSNSSSQLSHTNNSLSGRESPSTSIATSCLVDSANVDPRLVKKIEEQENAISKLTKQLSQCEVDLKGNIDLVTNLESALNETERNLRKSRLQMNELAKERDKITTQNESLRKELASATAEVENVRNNVQVEKLQFENQLSEERRAKENAKKQLEARMEEMQNSRMTRKSKFNCF
ncbi:hypothetical protein Pst134EB_018249 [Puccinia striiformis f. sp. tritici]|nr:hypothetical protein Pst134EB_018249 [Puccinia striiformis f. sp. tritici]